MFRRLVLAFEPLQASVRDGRPLQEQRSVGLMLELRALFALLAASRRKYVNPGRALELLRDAFVGTAGGAGGSQVVVRTLAVVGTDTELLEDSEGFGGLLHSVMSRRLILTVIIGTVILILFKHFR
ncbi:hypothetical protein HPB52_004526 [Rhipicephalus sanguineus]|uniref:Uncharacterized protein n=1 Tax=Rhipicephalus sanguineus TaxID=34632 RepID=A0A9D4PQK8_RHISA|nr:hypothetical protein HPB52_004526 [Rhipicephalus sanguineus]